jgi:carbon starvation protein
LVLTALAAFAVAYRFYGAFLATRVAMLNDRNPTPAHRLRDDVDYHPTRRLVLFGVHFAAIAGPGPLVGPVLASQWGYFPGFAWIVIGACLAGGVHDFVILLASVRQDGMSLPQIARNLHGPISGVTTTVATLFIVVATLAGVAMVVVHALSQSAWGMFTIVVTIPAALITGVWMNKIRPGRIAEASIVGVSLVMLGVLLGKPFGDSAWGHYLVFSKHQLSVILPVYAAIASILPVWILLCPRDYLSSYMKIGVIVILTAGIFVAHPTLQMPATTPFVAGNGPVVPGSVWPFVCIVIMCGALSGFHALISSGTTPKMVNKESDIRPIGYGGMLLEGFVSITALVAACALEPGDYFRINYAINPPPEINQVQDPVQRERLTRQYGDQEYAKMVQQVRQEHNWDLAPVELASLEAGTKETLASRVGGAVTLAVGMAKVFASLPGMKQLTAYWYHFVIMFEALFILTLLETGTRVARFICEDSIRQFRGTKAKGHQPNWALNVSTSVLVCFLWGYLLYTGNIANLWRMMGIANQLLATIALAVGTTYLLTRAPKRIYALATGIPLVFVVITVFIAGVMSIQNWQHTLADLQLKLSSGGLSALMAEELGKEAFSLRLMCLLAGVMLVLSALIIVDAVRRWRQILRLPPSGDRQKDLDVEASAGSAAVP